MKARPMPGDQNPKGMCARIRIVTSSDRKSQYLLLLILIPVRLSSHCLFLPVSLPSPTSSILLFNFTLIAMRQTEDSHPRQTPVTDDQASHPKQSCFLVLRATR